MNEENNGKTEIRLEDDTEKERERLIRETDQVCPRSAVFWAPLLRVLIE